MPRLTDMCSITQRLIGLGFAAGLAFGFFLLTFDPQHITPVLAQSGPSAAPTPDRLAPPPMPANPTQADRGAQVYYLVCMACHGDRGQGLTDEWRAAWAPGDQNCWQSKCHAANYPPQGFQLPRSVPPVIGRWALTRFKTVAELYEYLRTQMPWQAPGSLQEDEYWQLTAFLLRSNGIASGRVLLGSENASHVRLHRQLDRSARDLPADFRVHVQRAGLIAAVLLLLVLLQRRARGGRHTMLRNEE